MANDVFRFVKRLCLFSIELKGKKKYLKRQKKKYLNGVEIEY